MSKVIDVSSYNGTINWKRAKEQGVSGAIIKIIRKDLTRDNQFNANYKGCESIGMPWGVYNYSYATTVSKAKSDMNLVCDILDKIDKKHFLLGVWFDLEDKTQEKLSKAQIASLINAAESVVVSRGHPFGVYTGLAFYKAHINRDLIDCKNWWIARYYKGYDAMNIKANPNESYKPLPDIVAWQYTSSGRFSPAICKGNDGNVDLNILYKQISENGKEDKNMKVIIGSARIDERGKISGGKAGDQKQTSSTNDTKGEVSMQNFYVHTKGWYILRPKSVSIAKKIANSMKAACNNANIGYDQSNRFGIIKYGTASKTKTECDCGSLVRQCIKEASGKDVGDFTTANEAAALERSGIFESRKIYKSGDKLYTGDVLVTKTKGHTVVVTDGYERTANNESTGGVYMFEVKQIKKGSDGKHVKLAQKILKGLKYYGGSIDGEFGSNTDKATRSYQKDKGLSMDGVIGTNTWKSLIGI